MHIDAPYYIILSHRFQIKLFCFIYVSIKVWMSVCIGIEPIRLLSIWPHNIYELIFRYFYC